MYIEKNIHFSKVYLKYFIYFIVLKYILSKYQSYKGQEEVRGILCDVYVSCQFNEVTKENYTIEHYFSSKKK